MADQQPKNTQVGRPKPKEATEPDVNQARKDPPPTPVTALITPELFDEFMKNQSKFKFSFLVVINSALDEEASNMLRNIAREVPHGRIQFGKLNLDLPNMSVYKDSMVLGDLPYFIVFRNNQRWKTKTGFAEFNTLFQAKKDAFTKDE